MQKFLRSVRLKFLTTTFTPETLGWWESISNNILLSCVLVPLAGSLSSLYSLFISLSIPLSGWAPKLPSQSTMIREQKKRKEKIHANLSPCDAQENTQRGVRETKGYHLYVTDTLAFIFFFPFLYSEDGNSLIPGDLFFIARKFMNFFKLNFAEFSRSLINWVQINRRVPPFSFTLKNSKSN